MTVSSSYGQSTSTPTSVTSPQSDFELALAQALQGIGNGVLNWAQTQFGNASNLTENMINNYMATMKNGMSLAGTTLNEYEQNYPVLQNEQIQDANSYASTARTNYNMGQAIAAAAQTNQQTMAGVRQQLEAMGVNPSSGMYQELLASNAPAEAATEVGAAQAAEQYTENTARSLRQTALGNLEQLPGATVNALESALTAISGAENSELGLMNTGVNLMDSASPYFNAAMSLKYPPVGQTAQSTQQSSSFSPPSSGSKGNSDPRNPTPQQQQMPGPVPSHGQTTDQPGQPNTAQPKTSNQGNPQQQGGSSTPSKGAGGGAKIIPLDKPPQDPNAQQPDSLGHTLDQNIARDQTGTDWSGNPVGSENSWNVPGGHIDPSTGQIVDNANNPLGQENNFGDINPSTGESISQPSGRGSDTTENNPFSTESTFGNTSPKDTGIPDPNQFNDSAWGGPPDWQNQQQNQNQNVGANDPSNSGADTGGYLPNPSTGQGYGGGDTTTTPDTTPQTAGLNQFADNNFNSNNANTSVNDFSGQNNFSGQNFNMDNFTNSGSNMDTSGISGLDQFNQGNQNFDNSGNIDNGFGNSGFDNSASQDQGLQDFQNQEQQFQDEQAQQDQFAQEEQQMQEEQQQWDQQAQDAQNTYDQQAQDYYNAEQQAYDNASSYDNSGNYDPTGGGGSGDTSSTDTGNSGYDPNAYTGSYTDNSGGGDTSEARGGIVPAKPMKRRPASRPVPFHAIPVPEQHPQNAYRGGNIQTMSARPQVAAAGGGAIPDNPTTGGFVSKNLSPSQGRKVDDIPARLNADEFVIPRDVVHHLGQQKFETMIRKSREARMAAGGPVPPEQHPRAPIGAQRRPMPRSMINHPRFISRPMGGVSTVM